MMETTTRRSVIGAMAVGATALGGIGLLRRGNDEVASGDRITVVPGSGGTPNFRPIPHEVKRWTAATGEPISLIGETGRVAGTIHSVVPLSTKDHRPAGVRQQPFMVRFSVDAATAPAGDRMYALSTPIDGLTDIFVTRGADVAGKAILMAVFG